jgi:hypothetical protein
MAIVQYGHMSRQRVPGLGRAVMQVQPARAPLRLVRDLVLNTHPSRAALPARRLLDTSARGTNNFSGLAISGSRRRSVAIEAANTAFA